MGSMAKSVSQSGHREEGGGGPGLRMLHGGNARVGGHPSWMPGDIQTGRR